MSHVVANDLRNAVLQAAIEGKLTKQLSEDNTVENVITKCRNDKEEAISNGKYKKEQFRGALSKETYPFEIPDNWRWMYISDMSLFQEGPGILAVDFRDSGVPLIRIAGVQTDVVRLTGCNYLDEKKVTEKWDHFKLDKGDVLISTSASMDKVAEVTDEAEGAIPYTGLIRFKMYGDINKKYFILFIKSPFYKNQIDEQKAGGMIKHYGPSHLRKMLIPVPPIEEQARIVSCVEELMTKIDEYEKLENELAELKARFPGEMKEAILQAALEGNLTEQLESEESVREQLARNGVVCVPIENEPFDIPNTWEWHKFGEFGELKSGFAFKSSEYVDDGIQVVRISDLGEDVILPKDSVFYRESDDLKKYEIKDGSFLICLTGSIGKMARVNDGKKRYLNQRVGMFIPSGIANDDYLWMFLHSNYVIEQWIKAKTSTNGNIKNSNITELLIPTPPLEEQQRIVDKLDSLLPLCDDLAELA